MKILIIFSSPNHEEYNLVWAPLIDGEDGYIRVNDIGDKIYPFNGKILCTDAEWNTGRLVQEIGTIEKDNNSSECVVMLHDDIIPNKLKDNFKKIRFVPYGSGKGTFYKEHIIPFVDGNIKECFDRLWKELQEIEATENIPEETIKSPARLLAESIIIHDCNNAITNLSVALKKLNDSSGNDRMNGKEMICALGAGFIEEKYNRSMPAYEKIKDAFHDQPAIMAIPEKLAAAREKYAVIYDEAKGTDSNCSQEIVDNGQLIIRLLQEIIDILEEVIQNG